MPVPKRNCGCSIRGPSRSSGGAISRQGAQFWLAGASEIGVLEPAGAFVVLSVRDGREVLKAQAEPLKVLDGIFVSAHRRPVRPGHLIAYG